MTEQELKKEVRWMKRVTKDMQSTDTSVDSHWHPKWQRFVRGLMELGNKAEAHDSWDEWWDAMNLCGAWNRKYPNAEIWMNEPYPCDDMEGSEAHIEDETFRFTF